jgi:hypothetical protein
MKFRIILCSAFFGATLFNVGLAVSQTTGPKRANPSQAVSAAYQQAMDMCQEMYGGRWMGHQRSLNIETCFKSLTGKYPGQVNLNCTVCNCTALMPCIRSKHRCLSNSMC